MTTSTNTATVVATEEKEGLKAFFVKVKNNATDVAKNVGKTVAKSATLVLLFPTLVVGGAVLGCAYKFKFELLGNKWFMYSVGAVAVVTVLATVVVAAMNAAIVGIVIGTIATASLVWDACTCIKNRFTKEAVEA